MFSRVYDIFDYKQIAEKFLQFCSFWEETEDIVILSDRYDTWHGATIAIPIDEYKIDEFVTENIYIVSTGVETISNYSTKMDNNRHSAKYSLQNILKTIYPNANVQQYIYSYVSSDVLQSILDEIATYSEGKLIFCFSEHRPLYASTAYADVKAFLDIISNEASARGLDTYLVYTPHPWAELGIRDELYHSIESYVYSSKPRKVMNFYAILEQMRTDLPDALEDNNYYTVDADYRSIYGRSDNLVKPLTFLPYSRNIIHLFTRFILSNVFHKDREEYYVSFMYNGDPKLSYQQWINRADEYMSEDFHMDQYKHGSWYLGGKYGQTIFKESGQLVSIGVHTSFDANLWMCEQGGITCKKEADAQENDLDLLDFYSFSSGSPDDRVKPPVFPTTGCPWFTISDKNIIDYGLSDFGAKLYITRVGSSFILTVRLMHQEARCSDVWQSITFGEFVGRQDGYNIDQFYCAGGNQALSPDSWSYTANSHIVGLRMDLDIKNSAIVNSGILHPGKFNKTNLSNFRVMGGDGTWEDIYSGVQDYEEYQYLDSEGKATINTWGVPLTRPNFDIGNNLSSAYPYMMWQNKLDTYTINRRDLQRNSVSGKLDPLTIYIAK